MPALLPMHTRERAGAAEPERLIAAARAVPEAERPAFLDRECGADDALRGAVVAGLRRVAAAQT